MLTQCLAPHPKPSLRSGFDLSPQERGEVKKGAALRPGHVSVRTAAGKAFCLAKQASIGYTAR
jgi:hypothetical protein